MDFAEVCYLKKLNKIGNKNEEIIIINGDYTISYRWIERERKRG